MTLAQFPELQKLALADELWIDATSDKTPVPAQHKKILADRWRDYKSGKAKTITLDEMERRLVRE